MIKPSAAGCLNRFNPRPREGATLATRGDQNSIDVSIHAPVRGRLPIDEEFLNQTMFQSTPP